jgi:hypothetical protein
MRKMASAWLVLLIFVLFAPPLSAECAKCVQSGLVCNGGGWCEQVFTCET